MRTRTAAEKAYARVTILRDIASPGTGAISVRAFSVPCQKSDLVTLNPVFNMIGRQQADVQWFLQPYVGCSTAVAFVVEETQREISPVVTPAEIVNVVRNAFMLNVSDAARVFGVTRPTIYQWATLTDISQVRARAVQQRMKKLYKLSQEWVKLGRLTGRWAHQVLRSGQSVIDLLCAEPLDREAILEAHMQLLALTRSLRDAEAARAINAAKALGPAFDKLAAFGEKREREGVNPEPAP